MPIQNINNKVKNHYEDSRSLDVFDPYCGTGRKEKKLFKRKTSKTIRKSMKKTVSDEFKDEK